MRLLYKNLEIIQREIEILEHQKIIAELREDKEEQILNIESQIKEKQRLKDETECIILKSKRDREFENEIIWDDCFNILHQIPANSIDLFLSDIPYGINLDEWDVIHNNTNSALLGASPAQIGKSGFKRRGKPINGWNNDDRNNNRYYEEWCYRWSCMLFHVMKEGAPVLIFGGRRTIHSALNALERAGFLVRDILAWKKDSAHHRSQDISKVLARRGEFLVDSTKIDSLIGLLGFDLIEDLKTIEGKSYNSSKEFIEALEKANPVLAKKFLYELLEQFQSNDMIKEQLNTWSGWKLGNLAPIYEPIAWLMKPYSTVTLTDNLLENKVGAMNIKDCLINGKSPTNLLEFGFSNEEKQNKLHDAQKPLELIKYLIKLTTLEGQTVLDPFVGSGTTAVACKELNRNYIAIEKNHENYKIAKKRLDEI